WLEREIASKKFIRLLPDVSEEEKNKVLCSAKAMVLPSSGEALPYASLEAMACGTPPVVSYAVPRDVVIHGYNGLRVETLNPVDYANTLEKLLRDEELWVHIHQNAMAYVRKFDYIEVAREYLELIEEVVKTAG
ncbi:MAG: glycosyltransferase, partial [Thermofilaceae archaeon]